MEAMSIKRLFDSPDPRDGIKVVLSDIHREVALVKEELRTMNSRLARPVHCYCVIQ